MSYTFSALSRSDWLTFDPSPGGRPRPATSERAWCQAPSPAFLFRSICPCYSTFATTRFWFYLRKTGVQIRLRSNMPRAESMCKAEQYGRRSGNFLEIKIRSIATQGEIHSQYRARKTEWISLTECRVENSYPKTRKHHLSRCSTIPTNLPTPLPSELTFQATPMAPEPFPSLLSAWQLCSYDIPKGRAMVVFQEMRKFMNDHVVDDHHRGFDKPPIENHGPILRA